MPEDSANLFQELTEAVGRDTDWRSASAQSSQKPSKVSRTSDAKLDSSKVRGFIQKQFGNSPAQFDRADKKRKELDGELARLSAEISLLQQTIQPDSGEPALTDQATERAGDTAQSGSRDSDLPGSAGSGGTGAPDVPSRSEMAQDNLINQRGFGEGNSQEPDVIMAQRAAERRAIEGRRARAIRNRNGALKKLLATMQEIVKSLEQPFNQELAAIVPDEDSQQPRQFVIETETGRLLKKDEFIEALKADDGAEWLSRHVRMNKKDVETKAASVFERMTIGSVTEERDPDTYIQRFQQAYNRLRQEAETQEKKVHEVHGQSADAVSIFEMGINAAATLEEILLPVINQDLESEKLKAEVQCVHDELTAFKRRLTAYRDYARKVETFLGDGEAVLRDIHRKYCIEPRIKAEKAEALGVARQARGLEFLRPIALLWAVFVTVLTKGALATSTSEIIHLFTTEILSVTFVTVYAISVFIGRGQRKRRMERLEEHARSTFRRTLGLTVDTSAWGLVNRLFGVNREDIQFSSRRLSDIDHSGETREDISSFRYLGAGLGLTQPHALDAHTWRLAGWNLLALALPAATFFMVYTPIDAEHQAFVATHNNGSLCVYASGRLVYSDADNFYVDPTPHQAERGSARLIDTVLPEMAATPVPRDRILLIAPNKRKPDEACDTPLDTQPLRVTHEGDELETIADAFMTIADRPPQFDGDEAWTAVVDQSRSVLVNLLDYSEVSQDQTTAFQQSVDALGVAVGGVLTTTDLVKLIVSPFSAPRPGLGGIGDIDIQLDLPAELHAPVDQFISAMTSLSRTLQEQIDQGDNTERLEELRARLAEIVALVAASNENVASALERETEGVAPSSPAIVTPVAIDVMGSQLSAVSVSPIVNLPAESAGSTTNVTNTFFTHISVPGVAVQPEAILNALVMPFFPRPMENSGVDNPNEAFFWGMVSLVPPVIDGAETYFDYVARGLHACIETGGEIKIAVRGYASESWQVPPMGETDDELNWHLGEGRRAAILLALAAALQEIPNANSVLDKVLVATRPSSDPVSLDQYVRAIQPLMDLAETFGSKVDVSRSYDLGPVFGRYRHFNSFGEMTRARSGWMSDVLPPRVEGAANNFEELFARSVVFSVEEVVSSNCRIAETATSTASR
ncbi:MAG: hypothetical protein AAF739_16255 [Pseudomonadota bacterium]